MQMPVLMGTNLLMFGRSVSGFKAGSAVNKDVIWDSATEAYVSKLANKGVMSSTLSKLKPVAVQGLNEFCLVLTGLPVLGPSYTDTQQ